MLNCFQLEYFLFSVGIPNGGGVLQLGKEPRLKAVSQTFGFLVLMFRSIKPRIPLAVAVKRFGYETQRPELRDRDPAP